MKQKDNVDLPDDPSSASSGVKSDDQGQNLTRLIVNGRVAPDPALHEAVDELRSEGHHIEVRVTWEKGDAALFAAEGALAGFNRVIAVGGDGTLNEVLNGLLKADPHNNCSFGIVPYGTGNDFATFVGIQSGEPEISLRRALENDPIMVDVGRVNGQLYINVASGGFGAEVTSQTPSEIKSLLGSAAYPLFGLANVGSIAARPTHVRAPDFEWDGDVYMLAVGNGCLAGGGFRVCANAKLNDGLLDLVIIPDVGLMRLVSLVNDVMKLGKHTETQHVIYKQVPWVEIEAEEGLQVNLDGEPLHGREFRFDIAMQVPMHIPQDAPLRKYVSEWKME